MTSSNQPLRVALLTYRGGPHSGGQGVYIRYLGRALHALGHDVTVFSGPPYPDVTDGIRLERLPSLDLYRPDDPFRRPRRKEFQDGIDALEYAIMCAAGFPEPLTFSLRAARALRAGGQSFDIVHDNQCLGYGLLSMQRAGLPVVATIHHPIPLDRKIEVENAPTRAKKMALRRWYSFSRMQGRVARRLPRVIAVSEQGRDDSVREFGIPRGKISVIHNGVDSELFRPLPEIAKRPGRIITTASADVPSKGLVFLIEAVAKLNTEREVELVVVGKSRPRGPAQAAIDRYGLDGVVRFESNVEWLRLVELYAGSEVAVVPSLYEGFSLPAAEAMSCGVPLVATTGGALPEVTGRDGDGALLVPPGDTEALVVAICRLLDDAELRSRLGRAARVRVVERFSWDHAARATTEEYRRVLETC